jgi:endonuclease-3
MLGNMSKKYDPYKILISTILSARSRDETTEVLSENLFKKYPTVQKLAKAKQSDVVKIIKSIGFYNNKSKNVIAAAKMVVDDYKGKVPKDWDRLLAIPGVGRKVAGCVRVYAFNEYAIPVDTHVHRIANRLGWVETTDPEKTEKELMRIVPKEYWNIVNDTLVSHGKTICIPQTPRCTKCPIFKQCKRVGVEKYF